jgi:hypothetical protein
MPLARRSRSGANMIEFALILPTFLLMLMGLMDFGWLFFMRTSLDGAATRGCRAGALIDPGEDEANLVAVHTAADDAMRAELALNGSGACGPDCYTRIGLEGDPPGRSLICEVGRRYTPLVGMVLGPMDLESRIAVRMEWQRWPN